ncbi:MAG: hypothetical protein K8R50_11705 [Betaproteobacteria bacterium]|nr:hypothetical protein [Betaproteobacteria bacterium]MCX7195694.1 hypothetical protein [Pseudomonadota bacterium]
MEWLPAIGDGIIQNGCFLDTRLRTIDMLLPFENPETCHSLPINLAHT